MKILSLAFLVMASIAFVLLGCSDNSVPIVTPTSIGDNTTASLMKESGPGAWVFKYDYNIGWWFLDENGLLLTLGINDLSKYCDRQPPYFDEFAFKDIYLPNADPELRRIMEQANGGDVAALLFQVDLLPPETPLRSYICGKTPIFFGTASFIYTDNDAIAYLQDNENANAFGYKAHGILTGLNGHPYNLNLVYRAVWNPDGKNSHEVFKIQLTPVRGK
jgi:hypothetical protein